MRDCLANHGWKASLCDGMLGRVKRQVNLEESIPLGHRFGPLGALRTTRIAVVRKGSLRGYRKLLNLLGRELQKNLVSKVQVANQPLSGGNYSHRIKR
jgi:hypothetical protein